MTDRLVASHEQVEEREFETTLRPRRLAEFIGQAGVKANLEVLISAARQRREPVEHS